MKIYTKKGDQGDTSLLREKTKKDDLRIHIVGEIDLASVMIAEAIYYLKDDHVIAELRKIDDFLFKIATKVIDSTNLFDFQVKEEDIAYLEKQIDAMDKDLSKLSKFITYEGTIEAIKVSLLKTQIRKIERLLVEQKTEDMITGYINRLSDYLFVLARYLNHQANKIEMTRT